MPLPRTKRSSRQGQEQAKSSAWITVIRRKACYDRDAYRCYVDGQDLRHVDAQQRTLDHIVPCATYAKLAAEIVHRFGSKHKSSNIITCCKTHNAQRGDRSIVEYIMDADTLHHTNRPLTDAERSAAVARIQQVVNGEFVLDIQAAKNAVGDTRSTYANCWRPGNSRRLSQGEGTI